MYATVEPSWKPNSDALESDRPHHIRAAADVIAQQYSSANFALIPARKDSARLKNILFFTLIKKNARV
jgi:hypothetical protein